MYLFISKMTVLLNVYREKYSITYIPRNKFIGTVKKEQYALQKQVVLIPLL